MVREAPGPPISVRTHPRCHQQQGSRIVAVAGGVSAHEHVQRGFTAAVDFVSAGLVVRYASLTGGHQADRPIFAYEVIESLDDTQWTERIGDHNANEVFGRNVGNRFSIVVLDAGVDE